MEPWHPANGTREVAGDLGDSATQATLLPDGRVAIFDGSRKDGLIPWDPGTGEATPAPDVLPASRHEATVEVLPGDTALVIKDHRGQAVGVLES